MPVPSFDEILEQARKYQQDEADTESSNRTNSLIAGGISDLFKKTLVDPYAKKEYAGEVSTASGDLSAYQKPQYEGGTLASKLFGKVPYQANENAIPVTREEAVDYKLKRVLMGDKTKAQKDLLGMRIKAKNSLSGATPISAMPMSKDIKDLFYAELYPDLSIEEIQRLPAVTYGEAQKLLGARGVTFKDLGLDITLGKDFLGEIGKETKQKVGERQETLSGKIKGFFTKKSTESQPSNTVLSFNTIEEAEKANLPAGTIVTIAGRKARIK